MNAQDREALTRSLFSDEYLLERPLLKSIRSEKPVVLLIDDRFSFAAYRQLFPEHWRHCRFLYGPEELEGQLAAFWDGQRAE